LKKDAISKQLGGHINKKIKSFKIPLKEDKEETVNHDEESWNDIYE
jgi:hypothetical protein